MGGQDALGVPLAAAPSQPALLVWMFNGEFFSVSVAICPSYRNATRSYTRGNEHPAREPLGGNLDIWQVVFHMMGAKPVIPSEYSAPYARVRRNFALNVFSPRNMGVFSEISRY